MTEAFHQVLDRRPGRRRQRLAGGFGPVVDLGKTHCMLLSKRLRVTGQRLRTPCSSARCRIVLLGSSAGRSIRRLYSDSFQPDIPASLLVMASAVYPL
jgi:hypothetical protein